MIVFVGWPFYFSSSPHFYRLFQEFAYYLSYWYFDVERYSLFTTDSRLIFLKRIRSPWETLKWVMLSVPLFSQTLQWHTSCLLGSMDTSLRMPYLCCMGVVPAVVCYNFSEIVCVTMSYLYPCPCPCSCLCFLLAYLEEWFYVGMIMVKLVQDWYQPATCDSFRLGNSPIISQTVPNSPSVSLFSLVGHQIGVTQSCRIVCTELMLHV